MNNLDIQYLALLQDILDNGIVKSDRTGTGTISVFGRQIRHKMSDGFPLLTTKKMYWKGIVTELIWFLRGDTNIKYLVDNDCHIWDGDAYKNYERRWETEGKFLSPPVNKFTKEEFINEIKTNPMVARELGELGPIYGKQWRSWRQSEGKLTTENGIDWKHISEKTIDQIANSVNLLKTDPDSRRNKVSAWNVADLDQMALPPCHTDFQFYTRELSAKERWEWYRKNGGPHGGVKLISLIVNENEEDNNHIHSWLKSWAPNVPTRAISLMWNQRSVDTFLGLPFNIASYGLLLEIIAKAVNMVPDELIGNLGDTHLYLNHIDQAKLQISRELDLEERRAMVTQEMFNQIYNGGGSETLSHSECDQWNIPKVVMREPYPLPKLEINTEFWPTKSGECGIGNLTNNIDLLIKNLQIEDFQIVGYQSHPAIKAPLSN